MPKWFFKIHYNSNKKWTTRRVRSSLVNILGFLAALPLGSWRDIESISIERIH